MCSGRTKPGKHERPPRHALPGGFSVGTRPYTAKRADAQHLVMPQARLTVEASLSAYRVNRVDFLTLLDSQMTVFNYEIGLATAIAGYNKALAEIDLLAGKPPR